MTALALDKVCKSYGDVEVLKDVSIEVEEGEFVVVVGPSGCGKSTLLRIVAGLQEDVTSGTVAIDGQVVNHVPPAKRGIAMVFQTYALYPHLNVERNMSLGLRQEKAAKELVEKRVAEAARMLSLEKLLERRPAELSGGQRQRVAIGRAIVRQPKLFLFDEPLSNLDAALRINTRIELANLHRQLKASMVYVTHDQVEAMTLADRIMVLNEGVVAQIGTPMELYKNPANRFVAGFIGAPSINFLERGDKTMGIRPECLRLADEGLAGIVSHVERLGGDTNAIVATEGDEQVTVRFFGQNPIEVGNKVNLAWDEADVLWFGSDGSRLRQ